MYTLVVAVLCVLLQVSPNTAQLGPSLVPPSMTAAELWNPFSWYFPYGIAAANSWLNYLQNAQVATNMLYQHLHSVSGPSKLPANPAKDESAGGNKPDKDKPPAVKPEEPAKPNQE